MTKQKTSAKASKSRSKAVSSANSKTTLSEAKKGLKRLSWASRAITIFDFFGRRRLKRIKEEIKAKKELCEVQGTLNDLLREEHEIESS